MAFIADEFHDKKLKDYGINIRTKYIVGNKILERNTNNTVNDDIENGIRCEKEYYLNKELKHKEKEFDSRIEYTFISASEKEKEIKCPNCGMESKLKDFKDGCPYCKTYYNIEYTDKDLGSKYHYDRVLRNTTYRIFVALIDFLISLFLCYLFIKHTSRTFNNIDIMKVFIYAIILSILLYYIFYLIDAYVILGPIKVYKDKQNQRQKDFWNRTKLDKKKFFNNFNYEVRKYYYSRTRVIDYDVLDYLSFKNYKKKDKEYVEVLAEVRVITYENNKIVSRIFKDTFIFKHNENPTLELKAGANIIKCHNCGASIDANKGECEYCNTPIKYLQEWILEK